MSTIAAKIDVTKIDKEKLFPGKNGAKYLDLILIPSTNSRYGDDFMVVQSVSKEERARGIKGAILGNAKFLGGGAPATAPAAQQEQDDVPF